MLYRSEYFLGIIPGVFVQQGKVVVRHFIGISTPGLKGNSLFLKPATLPVNG
ncbi:MAG: hypothetical protein WDM80_18710 [Limisphaerales bacterium]